MSHDLHNPAPVKHRFFTPGVIGLIVIAVNGLIFLMGRFFFGLGAVTNLDNQYPWDYGLELMLQPVLHWQPEDLQLQLLAILCTEKSIMLLLDQHCLLQC